MIHIVTVNAVMSSCKALKRIKKAFLTKYKKKEIYYDLYQEFFLFFEGGGEVTAYLRYKSTLQQRNHKI